MAKATGFLEQPRLLPKKRSASLRLADYAEFEHDHDAAGLRAQASRCMNCGVPFCHSNAGCPLGNLIPEWNDLVYSGRMREALDALHATNNFPEITGRVCPAPCETACVLAKPAVNEGARTEAVTIKQIEKQIIDHAWDEQWVQPQPVAKPSGKRVAIVGSGPAGLACAQQLVRMGHAVDVFERDAAPGGLLRFGIPDFKLEKQRLDRRLEQLVAEGVRFVLSHPVNAGEAATLLRDYDAVVLAVGAGVARDLVVPGRDLHGVHFAMDYLTHNNRRIAGLETADPRFDAAGKHVVILGGGDTGSDCLGTALRQGAASVTQLELMAQPPGERDASNPWPHWPFVMRTSSSQDEALHGERAPFEREFAVATTRFLGDGGVLSGLEAQRVDWLRGADGRLEMRPRNEAPLQLRADLCLLAMGFTGAGQGALLSAFGLTHDARGNIAARDGGSFRTAHDKVFVCGDARRGQSLVVWAIAEGRQTADSVHAALLTPR